MATKNASVIPDGTAVSWPYRGTRGHGTVQSVYKRGTTTGSTEYNIREHDHHPGEPDVVHHYGRALTRGK